MALLCPKRIRPKPHRRREGKPVPVRKRISGLRASGGHRAQFHEIGKRVDLAFASGNLAELESETECFTAALASCPRSGASPRDVLKPGAN
jgi:hypothetical protein